MIPGTYNLTCLLAMRFVKKKYINMVVVDVNNLKNGRKSVKLQKESPAGCAGEGK